MIDLNRGLTRDQKILASTLLRKAQKLRSEEMMTINLPGKVNRNEYDKLGELNAKTNGAFGKLYRQLIED
ncbi:hypothetical protein V6R21_18830 [Limibacter armeniacum]|uniref:hypothetical protein n=1 Tax=Limibacter armeniacum TaxID=466084 RepID=UPI002FE5075F